MNLQRDFRLLLYVFVTLRLTLLIVFQPQLLEVEDADLPVIERGVTWLGDFREHYTFARAVTADNLPYRDYWVEFPPVWHALTVGVYWLVKSRGGDFTAWASVLYLVMLAFDAGNLWLIWRLGERLHGLETGMNLAWIYAVLASPLIMLGWNFEVMVSFSLLAGLWFCLGGKPLRSAFWIAFGILSKYIPLLILLTIWRFSEWRQALRYTLIVTGLAAAVLIPLLVWGGEMAVTSLTVQFGKPSYQTVWALVDGNYGTGSLPVGAARYQPEVTYRGNSPLIPAWLRLIPFAALGLWVFRLPMPASAHSQIAFFSLTLIVFMLWAQGWSPQWTVIVLPLLLLNFPSRVGVLAGLVMMGGAFIEYPLLFRTAAETENVISGANRLLFALLIVLRAALLTSFGAALIGKLRAA